MSLKIPEDFTEFLYWIKERTESFWNTKLDKNNSDYVCEDWMFGAKWIGMSEEEINITENKYNIKFTEYHRKFLKILHTIDRKELILNWNEDENGNPISKERSLFYNWMTDHDEIKKYLEWPYEFLLEDVMRDYIWLDSWGKKPEQNENKKKIFSNWFNNSPKLIPIYAHRFVISEPINSDNPVLSIYGHDTIIYGGNMRHYLINELKEELNLFEEVYDNEYEEFYDEPKKELKEIQEYELNLLKNKEIPVWKEFLISNGFNNYLDSRLEDLANE